VIDASRPNVILVNAGPHAHGCIGRGIAMQR